MWQVLFLGSEHTFINKTKIPILFLHGGDKITRQLNEMCSVIVICTLEKNEWRRKTRYIELVNIRLLESLEEQLKTFLKNHNKNDI